jgi:phage terminase large subunit-like protein
MRAGPKPDVVTALIDLSRLPKAGGDRAIAFIERFLRVPKGTGVKKRFRLRDWQREIVHGLLDDPRPRQGLLAVPRGNGKTSLAGCLGLYGLYADGVEGAEVIVVASDERQARILFNIARRMVELEPRLLERTQIYQDRLYVPATDSVLMALPAEPPGLLGFNPSLLVVDELGVVKPETWEAAASAAGKRPDSLTLAISTPAADQESVMWSLVELGRAGAPSFFYREYAAPEGCDLDDEQAWRIANPALGDFLHIDAMRAVRRTTREAAFRRFRLGQWNTVLEDAWLPPGAWDACDTGEPIEDDTEVIIGLDGSFSNDSTGLILATCEEVPHLDRAALWEKGPDDGPDWRVDVQDVEEAIRELCLRFKVREVVADPYRWTRSLQVLAEEGIPVLEYPQSPQRMVPATTKLFEAIVNQTVTHSGDEDLTRHIGQTVLRVDSRGPRLKKEHKHSTKRIDLAVAAVMAFDRATQPAPKKKAAPYVLLVR